MGKHGSTWEQRSSFAITNPWPWCCIYICVFIHAIEIVFCSSEVEFKYKEICKSSCAEPNFLLEVALHWTAPDVQGLINFPLTLLVISMLAIRAKVKDQITCTLIIIHDACNALQSFQMRGRDNDIDSPKCRLPPVKHMYLMNMLLPTMLSLH